MSTIKNWPNGYQAKIEEILGLKLPIKGNKSKLEI
jgi:hypothetical protein